MIPAKPIIRVTVWGEYRHEKHNAKVASIYPQGMHRTIADALGKIGGTDFAVRTATLDEPEHGLTDEVLEQTDVLTWWGHMAHGDVSDAVVAKVLAHTLDFLEARTAQRLHLGKPATHDDLCKNSSY